jgi:hydroxymethylpyrimidine pyrophosphatase-like HAD family hydrolase
MTKTTDKAGLWLTDFDGTIKPHEPQEPVNPADLAALKRLGAEGWSRAVVTGRSLFSFSTAWEPGLELDWLIFSSGAGLCPWGAMGPGAVLEARSLTPPEAESALRAALDLDFGFFAYLPPPDGHHFYYLKPPARVPSGFNKRLKTFAAQSRPFPADYFDQAPADRQALSQLLLMIPSAEAARVEDELTSRLPHLSRIYSASPFNDDCRWLEVLPPGVSKGRAAAALAGRLGLDQGRTVALGNDHNDRDLLDWAAKAFVTRDAPPDLLASHQSIPPAGRGGLAEAVARVLAGKTI